MAEDDRTKDLVAQLGDASFIQREAATFELAELGLRAKRALLSGVQGGDPEIRWRSARLWKAVSDIDFQVRAEAFLSDPDSDDNHEFPGWQRCRNVFGATTDVRELFIEMQKAEPVLWARLEVETALTETLFLSCAGRLGVRLREKKNASRIRMGSAATLLFLAFENRFRGNRQAAVTINRLVDLPVVQDALKTNALLRKMWLNWRERGTPPPPTTEGLMKALRIGLADEAEGIARELLREDKIPNARKPYALLALSRSDTPENKQLLRTALKDGTEIDTYFSGGVVSTARISDVALAALIRGSGQDPKDFGFNFRKTDETTIYYPSTLGFRNDIDRNAALEKWEAAAGTRP